MRELTFNITSDGASKIYLNDFFEELNKEKEICFESFVNEKGIGRSFETIIIILLSSPAVIVLANALRDLIKRKKIDFSLTDEQGKILSIKAQGENLAEVSEIMGYLTGNHTSDTFKVVEDKTFDNPIRISVKLEKSE